MGKAIEGVNWSAIQLDYQRGLGSCRVLAEKYGISPVAVSKRCLRYKWSKESKIVGQMVSQKVVETLAQKKIQAIEEHERETIEMCKMFYKDIILSRSQMHPAADPSALHALSSTLKTTNQVARISLGALDPGQRVDITSGGLPIGHERSLAILESCRRLVEDGKVSRGMIDVKALVNEMSSGTDAA